MLDPQTYKLTLQKSRYVIVFCCGVTYASFNSQRKNVTSRAILNKISCRTSPTGLQHIVILMPQIINSTSVSLSQSAITKDHRLGSLNNRSLCSHGSGGWKSKDEGARLVSFWWGPSSWLADSRLLSMFTHSRESEGETNFPSCKGNDAIMRLPPSWAYLNLTTSQRLHLQIPTH